MSDTNSVAPKERINIRYLSKTGGANPEVELPLRLMVVGDFTGKADETPIEERLPKVINKDNFNDVLRSFGITTSFSVDSKLEEDSSIGVNLKINSMRDFSPDSIVEQVPELKKMMELRDALVALRGPLGNIPEFRKLLQSILKDDGQREKLLSEIIKNSENSGE